MGITLNAQTVGKNQQTANFPNVALIVVLRWLAIQRNNDNL
jgi:hypothetical protein